jgi:hypothetical protein
MFMPPGITSSWTKNPPEEMLFRRELLDHGRGILRMNGYSVGLPAHGRGIHQKILFTVNANFKKNLNKKTS